MTPSLRVRLFVGHALVVVAALAVLVVMGERAQRAWLLNRDTATLERAARIVAHDVLELPAARDGRWAALADSLGAAAGCRVTLVRRDGRVVGDSDVPSSRLAAMENHASRPEVRAALAGRAGRDVRRSRTLGIPFLYVAAPARSPSGAGVPPELVVRLAEPVTVLTALERSRVGPMMLAAAIALLAALALASWIGGRQAARLRALEGVAARLGAGDPQARAPELPPDEVGRVGRALNLMAADLRERLDVLARERDERERILAHMTDGVALIDAAGAVVRMNHSMAAILGVPLPAAPGTPFHEVVRAPELDELVEAARAEGRTCEGEVRLWSSHPRLVRATATPLETGPREALLLVLHDLSESEKLQRVRQDFVANVSHELRTPLTSLRGYAETLLEGGLDDAEHRERFVTIIRDQAVRLEALLDDLLSLAELERAGARLQLERFDLRELAARQVASFRHRAERAGLALELQPGTPCPITADRARIEQVVANLVDNAIKYTERGGIRVTLGADEAGAWCEVRDTGAGIPPEDLPRIFERFYRVDKARSRAQGGTGLGLSIVKHIVALHDGEVSVSSTVGEGSAFRFTVPPR